MLAAHDSFRVVALLTLVVSLGIAVQWLASRARLPALLLLLATGLVLGPGTGSLDPEALFGDLLQPLISLSVAIVLFEGGLSLSFHEARRAGSVLWRLIVAGLVLGFGLVTATAYWLTELSLPTAAVLGAILVVTGPTVILPLLRHAKMASRPATLLKWEGIVNDPLGALLAVVVFQIAVSGLPFGQGLAAVLPTLLLQIVGASGAGALLGWLLGYALRKDAIAEHLKSPVMLAGVFLVYTIGEALGEEVGLLAVTVMGLVLANVREPSIAEIRHFKEQISVLLVSFLFIVLSARIDAEAMSELIGMPLVLVLLIVVVMRPIVAAAATVGTDLPKGERLLLSWLAPRGVVAAAVAGAFQERLIAEGYADARLLVPIVFGVIVVTVVAQGLSIRWMAQKLGLGAVEGNGILIVGASTWAIELSKVLVQAGAEVALVDSRYSKVSRARRRGIDAHFGDVMSEDTVVELPLERVTWLLTATDDDSYNALVGTTFARELGREHVMSVTPESGPALGRAPWGDSGTYSGIARAFWRSDQFKLTRVTEEFTWEALKEQNPNGLFLFAIVGAALTPIQEDTRNVPANAGVVWVEGTAAVPTSESA